LDALLCHGNEPRGGELAEMAAGGRPRHMRERGEFAGVLSSMRATSGEAMR
jgi:hypothetical protein